MRIRSLYYCNITILQNLRSGTSMTHLGNARIQGIGERIIKFDKTEDILLILSTARF